ncbi:MAG TPA: metallophosphoesterase [Caulobacteraceae bacterium]
MLRIAHLSDIHFGGENAAAVEAATAWLALATPDLTIITGDLTSFGQEREFQSAQAWVRRLRGPVVITPGNHDTPYLGLLERLTAPFARFQRRFGPADAVRWTEGGTKVATINTARGAQWRWNWSKGAIAAAQADAALTAVGGTAEEGLAAVVCHHPLVEMVGGPMTGRVRGGERAARRFCDGGVDVVLSGHIHVPFVWPFPYGDGRCYAVGAGTLSVRERGAPASFNLIEVEAGSIAVTAQAWTGGRFEVWRTWSVPRRERP